MTRRAKEAPITRLAGRHTQSLQLALCPMMSSRAARTLLPSQMIPLSCPFGNVCLESGKHPHFRRSHCDRVFREAISPQEELFRRKGRSSVGLRYGVECSVQPAVNGRPIISSAAQRCWGIEGDKEDLAAGTLSLAQAETLRYDERLHHMCSAHGW